MIVQNYVVALATGALTLHCETVRVVLVLYNNFPVPIYGDRTRHWKDDSICN